MAFQKAVLGTMALGVVGTFFDNSLHRSTAWKLVPEDLEKPCIGHVFTFDVSGNPRLGGIGDFAGILGSPQASTRQGLEPSLSAVGLNGELTDVGRLIVQTRTAVTTGADVQYDIVTGEICGAPSTPLAAGMAIIPGAKFYKFDAEASGLAVVSLAAFI